MPGWVRELLPIVTLLAVVTVVVARLPRIELGHSDAFRRRRAVNWLPVGLTYAFLYMGRYNLNACIGTVFDKAQFSDIYFWGTLTYGFSFVLNGPLTDRLGGKKTILLAAIGSLAANAAMGFVVWRHAATVPVLSLLYAINMYFQSFGAVAIVKVNSAWFHLRERGTFGGIFGILISLGLYFAYDWSSFILKKTSAPWVFWAPAIILGFFSALDFLLVKDTPGHAGYEDFDLGDASSGDAGPRLPLGVIVKTMLGNAAILTIAAIEFCSGFLRNSILQYYKPFAKETGTAGFVHDHWGMLNCVAGITGGIFGGLISDRIFGSRRGPVAAFLYAIMVAGALAMFATLATPAIGWVVVAMTLAIIGVHGMLSGTASMDFGGKRNVGVVVGVIDGCVYLGTALEAAVLGRVLPKSAAAHDPRAWWTWPAVIFPAAVVGFALATRVWNARPKAFVQTGTASVSGTPAKAAISAEN